MGIGTLKISVSGVRAIVGDTLTPQLVLKFSHAYGSLLKGGKVVLGRDSRVSGPMIKHSVIAGLLASGVEVIDIGICPVPTVHVMVKELKADGGIMITASHNPIEWNALKFINSEGLILPESYVNDLINLYHSENYYYENYNKLRNVVEYKNAIDVHINKVLKNINVKKIKNKKFKIVIDSVNGGGSIIGPKFLRKLGVDVIEINTTPNGLFPHNPEPVKQNLTQLMEVVKKEKADLGFAQDADADRLAIVDENGEFIGEELTLALAAMYVLNKNKTPFVTNLSSSSILDFVAEKNSVPIYRSKVGEANVVSKMREVGSLIGGEGGGGVIFAPVTLSRDSISAMGLVLSYLAEEDRPLSEVVKDFPEFFTIKHKINAEGKNVYHIINKLKDIYKNEEINTEDGIKILRKDGWIHIRPSNTEPIIRIIVETKDKKLTEKILDETINIFNKILKEV